MAIPQRILAVYQRLWAIWEADNVEDDGWANQVKLPNRIRFDLESKAPPRTHITQGKPQDFPATMLELGDFVDRIDTDGLTLGSERGLCGRDELVEQMFIATVASRALKIGEIDLLAVRMVSLIRDESPRLGLSKELGGFIDSVGQITARVVRTKRGMAAGTLRHVTTIRIPVNLFFPAGT